MEITGIYNEQKKTIEELKFFNESLNITLLDKCRQCNELQEKYDALKTSFDLLEKDYKDNVRQIKQLRAEKEKLNEQYTVTSSALNSKCDEYQQLKHTMYQQNILENLHGVHNLDVENDQELDEPTLKQEYTTAVIELTPSQIYHILDFIEDSKHVNTVVLTQSHELGIGSILTAKATVEINLTNI